MPGNHYVASVPKLTGRENYDKWAFAAQSFLVIDNLEECLQGTETDEKKIAKARAKLILTIDSALYVHVKQTTSAKDLWDKLKSLFDDSGFTRRISLLRQLISMRLENCESMGAYVNQLVETAQKLRGTGFQIDEEWIGSLLLAGLPEKFSPMIMAIEHSGISITTDAIKVKLLDMEGDFSVAGKTGSAFVNKSEPAEKMKHGISGSRSNVPFVKRQANVRCFGCKKWGHYKNKCPNKEINKQDDSRFSQKSKEKSTDVFSVIFLNGKFKKEDWYIDSGASTHITVVEDWIENPLKTEMKEVVVANNNKVPVRCVCDVKIQTITGKKVNNITVKKHFVPELTTNLLSVSQLIKNGNSVNFDSKGCKIYNRDKILIAKADLVDNVYKLNICSSGKTAQCHLASAFTWHRRLGHINLSDLRKMQNGAVNGLDYKGKIEKENCETCCEGKQTRMPFKHIGTRANGVLDLVHADVCGPMEVLSLEGSRYCLVLEDDYSKMCFVYFLTNKDEVFQYFKEFKEMVETQKDRKIKILRSDNGGAFCNREFDIFLKRNGIVHQTSNPYTPEQNGLVEWMNHTIIEKARCLLFDGELEKKFWAEAINMAVYLRNRSICSGLNDKTPYEVWNGVKPDLSDLKLFGATVMVHIPYNKRRKLDKKSEKMILVGYGDNVKGYRVYNPRTNSIITSRDVKIFENTDEKEVMIKLDYEENKEIDTKDNTEFQQE